MLALLATACGGSGDDDATEPEAALRQGRENEDVDVRRDAYSTLVEEFNANAVNMWLFYAPHSLVAAPEVRGLAAIGDVRFANFQPKTWLGGLWLSPS